MPPFVNSRTHSRMTFVSNSECFSSIVAGGGAVEANMVSITSAGSSFASFIKLSKTSCSSFMDKGSCTTENSGDTGLRIGRFDNLLQKDNRLARVLNTGDLRKEASELGTEISETFDRAEDGRWMDPPMTSFPTQVRPSEEDLMAGCERNLTRTELSFDASDDMDFDNGSSTSSSSKLRSVSGRLGSKDGRLRAVLREASVFNANLARSFMSGISRTPLTT